MRQPAKPNASNPVEFEGPGLPGVSIPDRRRIDSDVRAFLREPSTPWIVFDREGRPPSQLAVGEVLSVALSSVIPDHGFFPATAIIDAAASASKAEPSSLAVASDLAAEDAAEATAEGDSSDETPVRGTGRRARGWMAGAALAMATLGIGVALLRGGSIDMRSARSSAAASPRTFGAPVPAEIPPPDLGVIPAPAAAAEAPAPAPARTESAPRPGGPKFGKLSIRGEALSRDVFFDGKRLLGRGARSFTVFCGPHTIGVGRRDDVREVDVPCNAELVVRK